MQLFNLHKKIRIPILNLLFISGVTFGNPIGDIRESTGYGFLTRNSEQVTNEVGKEILLKDEAETKNGRMKIVFLDDEVLDMTENTYAYIDEAYYDPNPSLSRMSITMARGTARFTSGAGLKIKKANVNVSTPTAQITIKGTDFTTTVDELGRSLIVLLPDIDGVSPSGEIVVSNEGGEITLNEAYQATMVSSLETPPTSPVVIQNITVSMIDNMFIVNPPTEIKQAIEEQAADDLNQDQGILDVDFLEFNELETDYLASDDLEFSELDIDYLEVDFLVDMLDVIEELVRTTAVLADAQEQGQGQFNLKNASVGFNKDSQYNIFEQDGNVIFYRDVNGSIKLAFTIDASVRVETVVDGYEGDILLNGGEDSIIVIRQGG